MISYELAKKLKTAGFPQKVGEGVVVGVFNVGTAYFPTLSELLCSVRDHPMNRKDIGLYCNGSEWVAWARKTNLDEGDGDRDCRGQTPEEAVANLWLVLNAK